MRRKDIPKKQPRGEERRKLPTEAQMAERKATVARLLGIGMTRTQIRAAMEAEHGLDRNQTDYAIRLVLQDIATEYEEDRRTAKAEQVTRLRRLIAVCNRDKRYGDAVRAEQLLAKVLGTLEPIKVKVDADVTVRESLLAVVGSLSPEEMDGLVREQAELEAAAERSRLLGTGAPAPNGSTTRHHVRGGSGA